MLDGSGGYIYVKMTHFVGAQLLVTAVVEPEKYWGQCKENLSEQQPNV